MSETLTEDVSPRDGMSAPAPTSAAPTRSAASRRRPAILLLLLWALPLAAAETYEIGRNELGPAPRGRLGLRGASSTTGHLAAWVDYRSGNGEVFATRLTTDGAPLDGTGLRLGSGYVYYGDELLVASDGRDYLVVWNGMLAARVTGEGRMTVAREELPRGRPRALVSNGRSYLLLYLDYADSVERAILLDADGAPMSGKLACRGGRPVSAAPASGGAYFLVCAGGEAVAGAVLSEEQFGRRGSTRMLRPLPVLFGGGVSIVAGADERGLYTVRRRFGAAEVLYQRHDETGVPLGWPVRIRLEGLLGDELRNVFATTVGHALYIAYPKRRPPDSYCDVPAVGLVRVFETGAVDPVALPGGRANVRFAASLLRGTSAPLLLWTDHRYQAGCWVEVSYWSVQTYASLAGSGSWQRGGHLLSVEPRKHSMPRIARGSRGHLAVWREWDVGATLLARLIDETGRPLTEPVEITAGGDDATVAFDGERFLVVWDAGLDAVSGRFLDDRGNLSGDAFTISLDLGLLGSLVWDDGQYIVTGELGAYRLDRRGVPLHDEPLEVDGQVVYLTICAECQERYVGIRAMNLGQFVSAGPMNAAYGWLSVSEISERTFPVELYGAFDFPRDGFAPLGWSGTAPALATGNGTRLGIIYDTWAEALRSLSTGEVLPYNPARLNRARLQAEWTGSRFLVTAGGTLALHDGKGRYVQHQPIAEHARDSAFVLDGAYAVTVLFQRGDRIEATRIEVP